MIIKTSFFLYFFIVISFLSQSQSITYSNPGKDVIANADFDIVGKMNNNYLIYKNIDKSKSIVVYDAKMKLVENVKINFLPDVLLGHTTIAYNDFFYFIYQYQKNNTVTIAAIKIDAAGKAINEPVILDTSSINFTAKNSIYSVLTSEDESKILVYKVNMENAGSYIFSSFLFDNELHNLNTFSTPVPADLHNNSLSDFAINNSGTIAFIKAASDGNANDNYAIYLYTKKIQENAFNVYKQDIGKTYLNEIRLKADNLNNHFIITSLFADEKDGNTEGIYCAVLDENVQALTASKKIIFNDDYKKSVLPADPQIKNLNTLLLQNIVIRKDGGFIITSESSYRTIARNTDPNSHLWQIEYQPIHQNFSNSYLYNSDFFHNATYPWLSPYLLAPTNYFASNIAVLSFDSVADMEWSSVVPKAQVSESTYKSIGYSTNVVSGKVHFLFNQNTKKRTLLECVNMNAEGKATLSPTMNGLDKAYQFMPRFAKQVSSREVLIPCQYRNYLCFAKIEF